MKLTRAKTLQGRITVPGDKSISHRAAILAALADGQSVLENFSTSRDCASTLQCLTDLGAEILRTRNVLTIRGKGPGAFQAPNNPLDCGNSGSTMRMLAGVLAGQDFTTTLVGDASLSLRPMKRIIEPLELMGAHISSKELFPPLVIKGNPKLKPIDFHPNVASAQVKSCVLLAGLHANGKTRITEQRATRDHTERLLQFFGVPLTIKTTAATQIEIAGPAEPLTRHFIIPGDISSAAFFIAAAALISNSDLIIENVGLNPTRTQFLSVLNLLGLPVSHKVEREAGGEPVGSVRTHGTVAQSAPAFQSANRLPADYVPLVIDELPLLAVVGTQVPGGLTVRGARELRFKESDRIAATVKNLRAMNAEVDEFEDGFAVRGPQPLRGAALQAFGDHRIAMAFTIASLIADGESELDDPDCAAVSFPEFFELLESVVER